jgi:PAS domain S-box-containing protein
MHVNTSRTLGLLALATALVTLTVIGFLSYQDWRQFQIAITEREEVRRIMNLNETLIDRMRDAETGQRGFLLTAQPEYLQQYNEAIERIPVELNQLDALARAGSNQAGRFRQLHSLLDLKLAELKRTIELRQSKGPAAALEVVETGEGLRTMDRIRAVSKEIEDFENARWLAAWTSVQENAQQVRIITLLGAVLLVALVGGGGAALQNAAGKMERLIVQLDESRRSLERARDLLGATLYSIGDGVITTDREGKIQMMNGVAARLTGYSEAEARGQNIERIFRIVNEASRKTVEDPVRRVLRSGEVVGLANHTVLISKTGTDIPIDDSGSPIRGSDGKANGVVLVFRDVSERKRAEETARRLAAIVENSDDAIIGKTLDGVVTSWNQGAERLFGYSASEMVGSPISRTIPSEYADDMTQILGRIRTGELVEHHQTERLTKDGRRIAVSLTVSPIRDEERHVIGASKIARDVTRERQLEEMLRQTQKMEAVGRLAGGIAHDFNNLLNVILGYAATLESRLPAGDPLQKSVTPILRAAERAASLTGQLLVFSRKQVTQLQVLNLNALVQDMMEMLQRLIEEDIDLAVALDPSLGLVKADPGQLNQIVMNLALNARDAMPTGGKLAIQTQNIVREREDLGRRGIRPAGKYAVLIVTDSGSGMDEQTKSHIFEPFFTTKESGKGTGLGLATVHGIVQQHGGWIDVYSELNHGAIFRVYLPVVDGASIEFAPPVDEPVPRRTGNILLVEDEAVNRMLAEDVLSEAGHQVISAGNGRAALRLLEQHPDRIDLLITDVVMPEMGGPELAAHLASSRPGLAILYMSGYTDHALLHRGVIEQGTAFLQKPFLPEALLKKVDELLRSNVTAKT